MYLYSAALSKHLTLSKDFQMTFEVKSLTTMKLTETNKKFCKIFCSDLFFWVKNVLLSVNERTDIAVNRRAMLLKWSAEKTTSCLRRCSESGVHPTTAFKGTHSINNNTTVIEMSFMDGHLGVFLFQINYNLKQIKPLCQVSKTLCCLKLLRQVSSKFWM